MLATLPDALGDALGLVLARAEREWERQGEVRDALHRAEFAEYRMRCDADVAEFKAEFKAECRAQYEAAVALPGTAGSGQRWGARAAR